MRRPSPIAKGAFAGATPRRVSAQRAAPVKSAIAENDVDLDELEQKVKRAAEATKADVGPFGSLECVSGC